MKKNLFFVALAALALASCSDDTFVGENSPNLGSANGDGSIQFSSNLPNATRAGEFIGATAAEKLGGMFVVEGTKGEEQAQSPSTTVVFDNYLVGYTANTAGTTESNTHNWEYVGLQAGIDGKLNGTTWGNLHNEATDAKVQSIKYWDYSVPQYDFIAWSTGNLEAVTDAAVSGNKVKVTRIDKGTNLTTPGAFTLTAASATDLMQCYYTDINTVKKENYGKPVTLTFRNMAAKIRMALYETVPGYSVKEVQFYTAEATNVTKPEDLGTKPETATLFTLGGDKLPQSGSVLVTYPHIGTDDRDAKTADYNKASVTVTPDVSSVTTQEFGTLTANYTSKESASTYEPTGNIYLGRTVTAPTFAGDKTKNYYTAVVPSTTGMPLTLRVNYTLVSTDGSNEEIKVYGAKAVVPATYTKWQPNYAYTYIFKISDNSNGWTDTGATKAGLFPITFDAMVTSFVDANAEQTTITTVATPSITTYQQGHDHANKDEYSKTQKAGKDADNAKDLYVQVMDNSTATPTLKNDLNETNKSLFYAISGTAPISEATVYDALQNRKQTIATTSPINGRNGMILTKNTHITNGVATIVNGVNDQPISVDANTTAMIDIDHDEVLAGTYAYVYATKVPTADEKIYQVASISGTTTEEKNTSAKNYYEVVLTGTETPISSTAAEADKKAKAGMVYFVKNVDAEGAFVSYTFKQTKVGDDVTGLVEISIPSEKATTYTEGHFYFDVYYQNDGEYAVKVIKIVA